MNVPKPRNDLVVDVQTDRELGSRAFAEGLLYGWCNNLDRKLAPEYFGLGEPVRTSLREEGIEEAVRIWTTHRMPVMLRRQSAPRFLVSIDWRADKGLDPRPFPWSCKVWLDRSAGDELSETLFRFLLSSFRAAFGSIATENDRRAKHRIVFQDRVGEVEQRVGQDVTGKIPGIYWKTYFGPPTASIVGEKKFESLSAHEVERVGDGFLVTAYRLSSIVGTDAARRAEEQIINQLGREHFFDKDRVDIEALKADDQTVRVVETAVRAMKAGGTSRPH